MGLWASEQGRLLNPAVWDDMRVPVFSTKTGGSKDPDFAKIIDNGSGSQGVNAFLFSSSTEEELYFTIQIPHKWKYGTALHPHVHWLPSANGSAGQKVSWGLEYSIAEISGTFTNSSIIYGNTSFPDEPLLANKHYITNYPEISMTSIDSVSSMLICRVFRDATGTGLTDDYANDASLIEIDFHYEIDSSGSKYEYTKW